MAAHYLKEIRELFPNGPYLIGGHSFGGLVAYEMALQLQRQGHKAALVVMIDTSADILKSDRINLPTRISYQLKIIN